MQKNNELLFSSFLDAINLASRNTTSIGFISKLNDLGLSKLEIMIVDSAIKNMPLDNLYKTLLLKQDDYYKLIENATIKIINSYIYTEKSKKQNLAQSLLKYILNIFN